MELRQLGNTGVTVAELALGTMTFGREIDQAESATILGHYLEQGGNLVDTADVYAHGGSEEILGKIIGVRRSDIVLATKCGLPFSEHPNDTGASRRHIEKSVVDSLRRLRTDWIDLYQIHMSDPLTPAAETMAALDDLVRRGLVRYVGASNYAAWQIAKSLGVAALRGWQPFVSLQPEYSLVSRDVELELIPCCLDEGLAVLPWSPLGGGALTGKYRRGEDPPPGTRGQGNRNIRDRLDDRGMSIAETVVEIAEAIGQTPARVALNWVLHRPGVTSPIVGARTVEQLRDSLGASGWKLDATHVSHLDQVSTPHVGYPHNFHVFAGRRPPL